jgi:hypothetical protein
LGVVHKTPNPANSRKGDIMGESHCTRSLFLLNKEIPSQSHWLVWQALELRRCSCGHELPQTFFVEQQWPLLLSYPLLLPSPIVLLPSEIPVHTSEKFIEVSSKPYIISLLNQEDRFGVTCFK